MLAFRIIGWLVANGGLIVANILVALGFYFVATKPLASGFKQLIMDKFNGAPGTVIETLYYLNVDDYLTMIISAYAAKAAMHAGRATIRRKDGTLNPGGT